MVAVEARGDALGHRRIGQQIAGELFNQELVEGLVGVEGVDDPVAVGPDLAVVVEVQAVGVGVAGGVEPGTRHVLAIARRGEEAVKQPLVCAGRCVGEEGVGFFGRRRQAGEIKARAPEQRNAIGLRRRLDVFLLEAMEDERVDGVADAGLLRDRGDGRRLGRDERPVLLPLRAIGDPGAEEFDLLGREGLAGFCRRHAEGGAIGGDSSKDLAGVGVAGDDGRGAVFGG